MTEHEYVVVWLEEEYGYRYWRWEPEMTAAELIEWWKSLKSVAPYFFSPAGGACYCKRSPGLPGKLEELDWEEFPMIDIPNLWRAHIHEDEDSYLTTPGGESIHHAGYKDYDIE